MLAKGFNRPQKPGKLKIKQYNRSRRMGAIWATRALPVEFAENPH
jgi:hypothetical protein